MRIEEYLNSLEKKELIYIFLSIPIVVFIIYYNFIYPNLEKEQKKLTSLQKEKQQSLGKIVQEIRKVKKSKVILAPTRQKLENLKEDFKYINYNYQSLDILKLDDYKIYNIFTKLLNESNILGLTTSFNIKWDLPKIPPFDNHLEVIIQGSGDYKNIIKYLQFIDHLKSLIIIKNLKIALSLKDEDLLQPLLQKQKAASNSISFILTKYSDNTLKYLKNIAFSKKLDIAISVNRDNVNYLNISYKGNYSAIKSVLELLKNISKQKNKPFEFTRLRANLKFQNIKKTTENSQKFIITLQMVGEK